MNSQAGRAELHKKIDALGLYEIGVINEFVDALLAPVVEELLDKSWLTTSEWSRAFLARLRAHHALSREPLSTTQFEAAFENACEAAGWTVESAVSATQRFFDTKVTIPGKPSKRISLKATSARTMSKSSVHISKLTEAAWIQDVRRQVDRRDKIIELFREYRETCDAIVILRGFVRDGGVLYELIEIPTDLFGPIDYLDTATAQLATIPVPPNSDHPYIKIRIDRSDSKITVTQILLAVCAVHARWVLTAREMRNS